MWCVWKKCVSVYVLYMWIHFVDKHLFIHLILNLIWLIILDYFCSCTEGSISHKFHFTALWNWTNTHVTNQFLISWIFNECVTRLSDWMRGEVWCGVRVRVRLICRPLPLQAQSHRFHRVRAAQHWSHLIGLDGLRATPSGSVSGLGMCVCCLEIQSVVWGGNEVMLDAGYVSVHNHYTHIKLWVWWLSTYLTSIKHNPI